MKKKFIFSAIIAVLTAASAFTANATTQSLGYKLWDSNNGITATTDPSQFDQTGLGQVMHVQIKFDDVIHLDVAPEVLLSQFAILITSYATPEDAGRSVEFGVNPVDPTILDITLASTAVTAQTNSAITVKAADEETGLIPGIKDSKNNPVRLIPITSVQPTGLAVEEVSSVTGTASTPASVVYRMLSIPLVRGMNFLQARSNKSANPDGYLAREYFTFHSHSFFTMTALTHFTNLTATANIDTLQKVGYTLELVEVPGNTDNPNIKLTALASVEDEELSWVVYHYPYRSSADRKFELAQILDTVQVGEAILEAARNVLYDDDATAEEVSAAIASLAPLGNTGIFLAEHQPAWRVATGMRAVVVHDAPVGSLITVYQITGRIVSSFPAKSATETIPVPSEGVYIVRTGDAAVKVLVR
jgi:hypothetical protein